MLCKNLGNSPKINNCKDVKSNSMTMNGVSSTSMKQSKKYTPAKQLAQEISLKRP